jgi:hypothetical protein
MNNTILFGQDGRKVVFATKQGSGATSPSAVTQEVVGLRRIDRVVGGSMTGGYIVEPAEANQSSILVIGTLSGAFTLGGKVTGSVSGAIGRVIALTTTGAGAAVAIAVISGAFVATDTITDVTTTHTITSITAITPLGITAIVTGTIAGGALTIGEVATGTGGATGIVLYSQGAGAGNVLIVAMTSGMFLTSDTITGASSGHSIGTITAMVVPPGIVGNKVTIQPYYVSGGSIVVVPMATDLSMQVCEIVCIGS